MVKWLVVIVVLALVTGGVLWWVFGRDTGAVIETSRQGLRGRLEELVGKYRIQKTKIKQSIESCQKEVDRLQKAEADSTVEAEFVKNKLDDMTKNLESARKGLLRMADFIEKGEPLKVGDKEIPVSELRSKADLKKTQFETLQTRLDTYKKTLQVYTRTAAEAHQKWTEGKQTIDVLKGKSDLLDAKIESLEATNLKVESAETVSAFEQASKLVDSVTEDVDKERRKIEMLSEVKSAESVNKEDLDAALKTSTEFADELRQLAQGTGQ